MYAGHTSLLSISEPFMGDSRVPLKVIEALTSEIVKTQMVNKNCSYRIDGGHEQQTAEPALPNLELRSSSTLHQEGLEEKAVPSRLIGGGVPLSHINFRKETMRRPSSFQQLAMGRNQKQRQLFKQVAKTSDRVEQFFCQQRNNYTKMFLSKCQSTLAIRENQHMLGATRSWLLRPAPKSSRQSAQLQ